MMKKRTNKKTVFFPVKTKNPNAALLMAKSCSIKIILIGLGLHHSGEQQLIVSLRAQTADRNL